MSELRDAAHGLLAFLAPLPLCSGPGPGTLHFERLDRALHAEPEPIPLQLWCPLCGTRHIDEGEWATRVHHTHSCQNPKCGLTWRPAVVPTVGVYTLPGFLNAEAPK